MFRPSSTSRPRRAAATQPIDPDSRCIGKTRSGATTALTFWDLQQQANRLSNALAALGVGRGDAVAIILPQRPETAIAHIACYQMGAIAVPLSFLFGPDALEYRLQNAEAKVALVDSASLPNLAPIRQKLPCSNMRSGSRALARLGCWIGRPCWRKRRGIFPP